MIEKIERYYLEIDTIKNLKIKSTPSENLTIKESNENDDYVGYIELIFDKNICEIAYFGILEEYIGKGYGGFLLSEGLKIGFKNANRIWVHTCSLDHPNAIENYKSRGMKVFRTEILKRKAI